MKFQTVRKRIFVTTLLLVMIPLLIISIFCCVTSYHTSVQLVTHDIERLALVSSNRTSWELQNYLTLAESAGLKRDLSSPDFTEEQKLATLKNMTDKFDVDRGNIIRADGVEITEYKDFTSREYYINAMQGKSTITEPFTSALTGQTTTIIAAPLWSGGRSGTEIVGCVYFGVDRDFLGEIMKNLCLTENSSAYIFNSNGEAIAQYQGAGNDPEKHAVQHDALQEMYRNVVTGTAGVETYKMNGHNQIVGYSHIANMNDWTAVVCAPVSDFTKDVIFSIIIDIILGLVTLVAVVVISNLMGKGIGKPIQQCTDRIRLLADGDLQTAVPQISATDETGVLCDSTRIIVDKITLMIHDIDHVLNEMSQGNFDVHSNIGDTGYPGDFHPLLVSMRAINNNLSRTLLNIDQAANLVSTNSQQVSSAAQALGQGTVEQAASVEDLEVDMRELSTFVQRNAESANSANVRVVEVGRQIQESNAKMTEMIDAMSEINNSSDEIAKIIKTIEDIAFQTNILALNAAVEAARAGTAGKGFAVVADEVRNLATKSDQAAKATKDLISHSIDSVSDGTRIANETAVQLAAVVDGANLIIQNISEIAEASNSQAQSVTQIKDRLGQIAAVVQTNSASAQESAATAEELQSQANIMKGMMDHFTIRQV